jgi:hypothetical protein
MRKVWIEAALNGGWGRALQPGIPDTVEAIVAEGIPPTAASVRPFHAGNAGRFLLRINPSRTRWTALAILLVFSSSLVS